MFRIRWQGGAVYYGYRRAADLESWTYEAGYLTATIRQADPVLLTQSPLVLVAEMGRDRRPIRRELADVVVMDRQLSARVPSKGT